VVFPNPPDGLIRIQKTPEFYRDEGDAGDFKRFFLRGFDSPKAGIESAKKTNRNKSVSWRWVELTGSRCQRAGSGFLGYAVVNGQGGLRAGNRAASVLL
jgi:hypothetical protein